MATTGFWPVKDKLKDVLNYASNPDKTIASVYVDDDLYNTLNYVSNDDKTDKKMYVTGINCTPKRAYETMMATKKRFGKLGGNVAYHGYQSFNKGEVTPLEAHQIGIESVQMMWGNNYEILVTTHLNTDNIHNHFVINSVSFRNGKKFENHIRDHYRFRDISDGVCLEHEKSILRKADFFNGKSKEYWADKNGPLTHRAIVKRDLDKIILTSEDPMSIYIGLENMGYQINWDKGFERMTIKDPSWKRPIRLNSLGEDYTLEAIRQRIYANTRERRMRTLKKTKYTPLLVIEKNLNSKNKDGIQAMFELIIVLCKFVTGSNIPSYEAEPISPEMKKEIVKLDKTLKEYQLLNDYNIDSKEELTSFIESRQNEISLLERQRKSIYYKNRYKKDPSLNERARCITQKIKPLRQEVNVARAIFDKLDRYKKLLNEQRQRETKLRTRNRGYER